MRLFKYLTVRLSVGLPVETANPFTVSRAWLHHSVSTSNAAKSIVNAGHSGKDLENFCWAHLESANIVIIGFAQVD